VDSDWQPPEPGHTPRWELDKIRIGWFERRMRLLRCECDPACLLEAAFLHPVHELLRSPRVVISWAAAGLLRAMTFDDRDILRRSVERCDSDVMDGHLFLVEDGVITGLLAPGDDQPLRPRRRMKRLFCPLEEGDDLLVLTYARDEADLERLADDLPKVLSAMPPFAGHTHLLLDARLTPTTPSMRAIAARIAAAYPDPGLTFGWSDQPFCARPGLAEVAHRGEELALRMLELDDERLVYLSCGYEGHLFAVSERLPALVANLGPFAGHTHLLLEADTTPRTDLMEHLVAQLGERHADAGFTLGWSDERFCDRADDDLSS
jgi:hypothetical protein